LARFNRPRTDRLTASYVAGARQVAKRIKRARSSRRELKLALEAGLEFHWKHQRGYRGFIRTYARQIRALILSGSGRAAVARELSRMPVSLLAAEAAAVAADEGEDVIAQIRLAAPHFSDDHIAVRSCEACYGEVIEHALLERRFKRSLKLS